MKTVLISGATGMLGRALTDILCNKGYQIHALVRKELRDTEQIKYFQWNVEEGIIDSRCIENVDAIIHLAGMNIGKKPWSKRVRQQILKSRTDSINIIYKLLTALSHQVRTVISSSGTGYYGDRGDKLMTEDQLPSDNFLGQTCLAWEQAVALGSKYGLRCVYLRGGIILDKDQGALPILTKPFRFGFSPTFGNGKQWMPWIHIQDAVNMYCFALENEGLHGAYNMVAPENTTNRQFSRYLAEQLHAPKWLPPIPAFLLRTVIGQMSTMMLYSTKVSAERIINAGFRFQHPHVKEALADLYPPKTGKNN